MALTNDDLQAISGIMTKLITPIYKELLNVNTRLDAQQASIDKINSRLDIQENRLDLLDLKLEIANRKIDNLTSKMKDFEKQTKRNFHELKDETRTIIKILEFNNLLPLAQ